MTIQSNQFADEEVHSNYTYPEGYSIKTVTEQVKTLQQLFPGMGNAYKKTVELPLPPGAEGHFAIPRWQRIALTYGRAVLTVFRKLDETFNLIQGFGGVGGLKLSERTERMFQNLADEQDDHDMLVVGAQLGLRHRGRSVRRAREVFTVDEVGLDVFTIGIILLTHPELGMESRTLSVDCAGNQDSMGHKDLFAYSYTFHFGGDLWTYLLNRDVCKATAGCGVASAFFSKK